MTHNARILEGLWRSSREGRLHHAYVLGGPALAAKIKCVESFAAGLFAEAGATFLGGGGDADSILGRIGKRSHPDFTRIEPPGEEDKNAPTVLDQIRDLPKLLAFPPLEAPRRIVLISDAASLNGQACNSVLKILEEPPGHSMFFLLCRDPGELLQTIVSRCQVLRFAPLSEEELLQLLGDRAGEAGAAKGGLLAWAEGDPERAELLLREEGALELRSQACERLLELWEASPRVPSACAAWVEKVENDVPVRIVVDSWEVLLRDLSFVYSGAKPEQIRFRECYDRLARIAARGGEAAREEIPRRFSAINRFRVYQRLNGNLRLDFSALLTELQIFSVGKGSTQA